MTHHIVGRNRGEDGETKIHGGGMRKYKVTIRREVLRISLQKAKMRLSARIGIT